MAIKTYSLLNGSTSRFSFCRKKKGKKEHGIANTNFKGTGKSHFQYCPYKQTNKKEVEGFDSDTAAVFLGTHFVAVSVYTCLC